MSWGEVCGLDGIVIGYALCSSALLVVNKVAVHHLPAPFFVLLLQTLSATIFVRVSTSCGLLEVDEWDWGKARSFFPVALVFLAAIVTNMKTLQHANVETFIVFRVSTPLVIGVAEWLFMGRELPDWRSMVAMTISLAGVITYALNDHAFQVAGYMWVMVWYVIFCFDQLYIKHVVDVVTFKSNWGRVFYCNLWASGMLLVITLASSDRSVLHARVDRVGAEKAGVVLLSCGGWRWHLVLRLRVPRGLVGDILHCGRQRVQDHHRALKHMHLG